MRDELAEFIGERVNLHMAEEIDFDIDPIDNNNILLEATMYDYDFDGMTDEHGFNLYTINIWVEGMIIKSVQRFGHLYFGGGGSIECNLRKFDYSTLEQEAREKIIRILCEMKKV